MRARHLALLAGTVLAAAALAALVHVFDLKAAEVWARLTGLPWWLLPAATALALANIVLGAVKWRSAVACLGDAPPVPLRIAIETTALGTFLGQIAPVQITTAAVRALAARRGALTARVSVGTTMHEQVFDLLVLAALTVAGAAALVLDTPDWGAAIAFACTVLLGLALLRRSGRGTAALCRRLADRLPGRAGGLAAAAGQAAHVVGGAPATFTGLQTALSLSRLALLVLRAVIVAIGLAPAADPVLVALGFPLAVFAALLPVAPAGLGVVEWTWFGVLTAAGAPMAEAALAAACFRIVNLATLAAALALVGAGRFLGPRSASSGLVRPALRAADAQRLDFGPDLLGRHR